MRNSRCVSRARQNEADGVSIDQWSARYIPEQASCQEFREYASRVIFSPDGVRYDGTDHLMLRATAEDGAEDIITNEPQAKLLFDPDLWTSQPIRPVGYFFFDGIPVIAFEKHGIQVLAEHYELARAVGGPGTEWALIDPTPPNPMYPNGEAARMVRANGPGTAAAAFLSIFQPPGERSGIRKLQEPAG